MCRSLTSASNAPTFIIKVGGVEITSTPDKVMRFVEKADTNVRTSVYVGMTEVCHQYRCDHEGMLTHFQCKRKIPSANEIELLAQEVSELLGMALKMRNDYQKKEEIYQASAKYHLHVHIAYSCC
jgi:hypothetical protein